MKHKREKQNKNFIAFKMKLKINVAFCMLTFQGLLLISHLGKGHLSLHEKEDRQTNMLKHRLMVRLKLEVAHVVPIHLFWIEETDLPSYSPAYSNFVLMLKFNCQQTVL